MFLYPKWIEWFSYRKGMIISTLCVATTTFFIPLLSETNNSSKTVLLIIYRQQ